MRVVTPQLIVNKDDAFTNDILEREYFGEKLLNLVSNTNDALVISLDGKWGEGKTTFVKMWQGLLSKSNVHSIYFDAFANDYVDDAFISIMSAITNYADENIESSSEEKVNELIGKAKNVGGKFLSWTAKVGIKAATLGVIKDSDIEELKDIKDDLSKEVSDVIGKVIEERITSHKHDIELVDSFKRSLSELPSKLKKSNDKSLIIIIDELDRCKPTFAVEIIEKIKHLFSVENITFLLVMNKQQLEESIRSVYGSNIDSHTYLQKFITLETTIPKNTDNIYGNDFLKYTQKLLKLHEIETWGDDQNIIDGVTLLAEHFNLSLRQLEKVFTNIALFYRSSAKNHLRLTPIITFLSVIKVINPSVYNRLASSEISFDDLCNEIRFTDISDDRSQRKLYITKCWLKYALLTKEEYSNLDENDQASRMGQSLRNYDIERENLIPFFARAISLFSKN